MVKKNQGSALVILLVLSLFIGVLATVYFFKNNGKDCGGFMGTTCTFGFSCKIIGGDSGKCKNILFPISTPSDEFTPEVAKKILPLPDLTANWKTYTNSSDGYTIKYPANYSVSEVPQDYVRFSPGFNDPKGPQSETYLSIQLDLKPDLSKNPAAIYKTTSDGKTLRISQIMMDLDESQKPLVQAVFDQILSTFKFTDQNNVSGTMCGGWDTSGQIICGCSSGQITKALCPVGTVCDSGTYYCQGQCGVCCYKGIGVNPKYSPCD